MKKSEKMKKLIMTFKKRSFYEPLPIEILIDAKQDRVHTEKFIRKRIRVKKIHQSS